MYLHTWKTFQRHRIVPHIGRDRQDVPWHILFILTSTYHQFHSFSLRIFLSSSFTFWALRISRKTFPSLRFPSRIHCCVQSYVKNIEYCFFLTPVRIPMGPKDDSTIICFSLYSQRIEPHWKYLSSIVSQQNGFDDWKFWHFVLSMFQNNWGAAADNFSQRRYFDSYFLTATDVLEKILKQKFKIWKSFNRASVFRKNWFSSIVQSWKKVVSTNFRMRVWNSWNFLISCPETLGIRILINFWIKFNATGWKYDSSIECALLTD